MMRRLWQNIRSIDWFLFGPMLLLIIVGVSVIYGLSINPIVPDPGLFRKQLMFAVLAIVLFLFSAP